MGGCVALTCSEPFIYTYKVSACVHMCMCVCAYMCARVCGERERERERERDLMFIVLLKTKHS